MDAELKELLARYKACEEAYRQAQRRFSKSSQKLLKQDRIDSTELDYPLSEENARNATEAFDAFAKFREVVDELRSYYRSHAKRP